MKVFVYFRRNMSHSKPSRTTFQPTYNLKFPWAKDHPSIKTMAICTWCHKDINIKGMGKTALTSHAKSAKHTMNEKNRSKCLPMTTFLNKNKDENTAVPGPSTLV